MTNSAKPTRSDTTRTALVDAALEVFGRDGFHAASTRAIADLAGVNQASIAYHFGSKQGLYIACFEHIDATLTHELQRLTQQVLHCAGNVAKGSDGKLQAVKGIRYILFGLIELYDELMAPTWVNLVIHEQQMPSEAFDVLYEGVYGKAIKQLASLVAMAMETTDQQSASVLAMMLIGQIMAFTSARTTASRLLNVDKLGAEEIAIIKQHVLMSLCAHFKVSEEALT